MAKGEIAHNAQFLPDDKINVTEKLKFVVSSIENIVV